jgi:hypothetical protein
MPETGPVLELYARKGCAECRASATLVVAVARRLGLRAPLIVHDVDDEASRRRALEAGVMITPTLVVQGRGQTRRLLTLELEDDGQLVAALRAAAGPPPGLVEHPLRDTPPSGPVPPR